MFRVIPVVEPRPVIELVVGAHAPGNRLVWIAAVVPVVTIQIREAVAEIPERKKKTDVMPVQDTKDHKGRDEAHQLEHSPKRLTRTLAFQFFENRFGILAEETDKRVFQRMFCFTVMAVFVNRNPINGIAVFVRPVGITLVMLHMNALVENLTEANRDRFQDAEQAIQQGRTKIGIVNEVVGDAVDVPRNADGIDKTENQHHPKRYAREKVKHAEEVNAVQNSCRDRDNVPACVGKESGICLWTLDRDQITRRSSHYVQDRVLEYTIFT